MGIGHQYHDPIRSETVTRSEPPNKERPFNLAAEIFKALDHEFCVVGCPGDEERSEGNQVVAVIQRVLDLYRSERVVAQEPVTEMAATGFGWRPRNQRKVSPDDFDVKEPK